LGLDNYADVGAEWNKKSPEEKRSDFITGLKVLTQLAGEKNKVCAMTETGMEGVKAPDWYTKIILDPIKQNPEIQIAYLLVWRNANNQTSLCAVPGHASAPDFVKFFQDPGTLFEADLKNVYKN